MASLKDIAALCGISTTTVSLILNGRHTRVGISARTRARVLETAKELHYVFNAGARNIRSGHSDTIGVLSSFEPDSVYTWNVLHGITQACIHRNYTTKFFRYTDGMDDEIIRQVVGQRVAGVLLPYSRPHFAAKLVRECSYSNIPVVSINSVDTDENFCPNLVADNAQGGRLAAEALLAAGCRRIAYVQSKAPHLYWYAERTRSFLAVLAEHAPKVKVIPVTQQEVCELSPATELGRLLLSRNRPDGIFSFSDDFAFLLERFAIHNGISIPGDLSIVGYGNHPAGALLPIPLATIAEPLSQMGEDGLELLLSGKHMEPTSRLVPVQMIHRESLAGPK